MRTSVLLGLVTAALVCSTGADSSPNLKDGLQCAKAASKISCRAQGQVNPDGYGTCCYNGALQDGNKESGLVLATQFYDTNPSAGPKNSTTIHGLWPDYCDGSYPAYCTAQSGIPEYSGAQIESLIGKYDPLLLDYMKEYYVSDSGPASSFWSHEQNKHGTCFTTLRQKCQVIVPPGASQADAAVLGYFSEIVRQFRRNPTVQWLAEAGITPSNDRTYKLTDFQQALAKRHGGIPYIGCNDGNVFDEVWYYNLVQGPLVGGKYYPVDSTTNSSCDADVKYRAYMRQTLQKETYEF